MNSFSKIEWAWKVRFFTGRPAVFCCGYAFFAFPVVATVGLQQDMLMNQVDTPVYLYVLLVAAIASLTINVAACFALQKWLSDVHSADLSRCLQCKHLLHGLPEQGRCPECGHIYSRHSIPKELTDRIGGIDGESRPL